MEKEEIKKRLDEYIDRLEWLTENERISPAIKVSTVDSDVILVYCGIDQAAAAVGAKLEEDDRGIYCDYRYQYRFSYRGYRFHQYERERLPGYDVSD